MLKCRIARNIIDELIILLRAKKDLRFNVSYKMKGVIKRLTVTSTKNKRELKNKISENKPISK